MILVWFGLILVLGLVLVFSFCFDFINFFSFCFDCVFVFYLFFVFRSDSGIGSSVVHHTHLQFHSSIIDYMVDTGWKDYSTGDDSTKFSRLEERKFELLMLGLSRTSPNIFTVFVVIPIFSCCPPTGFPPIDCPPINCCTCSSNDCAKLSIAGSAPTGSA